MPPVANGFVELRNGMNAFRHLLLLDDMQCAKAVNVAFRGGMACTRPSFRSKRFAALPSAVFRGGGIWSLASGDRLVAVFGDHVYVVNLSSGESQRVEGAVDETQSQCFFIQADRYMLVQGFAHAPVVLEETDDGIVAVDKAKVELAAGYFGIYAHGRVHMVPKVVPNTTVSGKPYLVSGNVMEPDDPETVLKYDEVEYWAEGGAHGLPLELGTIGGVGVMRNSSTGSGLGAVIVLARNGLCAFDFSISRDLWKTQAISQVLFYGPGCRSPWAVVGLNDDLVYRSLDGIRSLRYSTSQIAGSSGALSSVPMSVEVDLWLKDVGLALPRVSAAASDNRLFCTAGYLSATQFRGLVVLDVSAAYYSGASAHTGAYDGLWTGLRDVAQVLSWRDDSGSKLLAITSEGRLYDLDGSAVLDPGQTPIEARIETKAYMFGDLVSLKKLLFCELWLSEIPVDTSVKVLYRPHGYPLWTVLGETTVVVPSGSLLQMRGQLRFPVDMSRETCDPVSGRPLYVASAFQFAIQWTGRAVIAGFRAVAEPLASPPPDVCPEITGAVLEAGPLTGETLDDFSYSIREEL